MTRLAITLCLVLGSSVAAAFGQTSVSLRPAATVQAGSPVRLGDIADLEGNEAVRLGALVVNESARADGETIDLGAVRAALDKAKVNWGRVTLSGRETKLLGKAASPEVPPTSRGSVATEFADGGSVEGGTLRAVVVTKLAALFAVAAADMRVRFPALSAADRSWLDDASGLRRVEVFPGAATNSARVPIRVEAYLGDRLESSRSLGCELQIRRRGAATTAAIDRDQAVGPEVLIEGSFWQSPSDPIPLAIEQAIGKVARRRIEAGRPVVADDLRSPMVVSRGEPVIVHCLSGGVVLKAKARALASARDGEVVRLQLDGSKNTFTARMSGRGVAVMTLDPAEPANPDAVATDTGEPHKTVAPSRIRPRTATRGNP